MNTLSSPVSAESLVHLLRAALLSYGETVLRPSTMARRAAAAPANDQKNG